MKKRLICILLAMICVVGSFFEMLPYASACEGCTMYGNTDSAEPYEDDRVEYVGCHGTIVRKVPMRRNPYEPRDDDPYLEEGNIVYVKCLVVDRGNFFYQVSMGVLGSGTVDADAVRLNYDYAQPEITEEENINAEEVGKHGTINRDVMVYRNRSNAEPESVQLNEGCRVYVKKKVLEEGKYFYTVSFGSFGIFTKVPIDAVTLEGEMTLTEAEPKKDVATKKEEPQKSTISESVDVIEEHVKVNTFDRYRFFTNKKSEKTLFKWNLNQNAFWELHLY